MGTLSDISIGIEKGKKLAAGTAALGFRELERHIFDYGNYGGNTLAVADNLEYMRWLAENGKKGEIKCIYIDPPFFTKAKYNAVVDMKDGSGKRHKFKHLAYDDTFDRDLEYYIENITARLILIRELMSDDGLLWIHLDWHSSHYVRVLLDEIFGPQHFVNEIIWKYKSGGSGKKHFARKHDTILVYSKTSGYHLNIPEEKSYNRGLKPYNFKGIKEYKDEYGWYTIVNMKDVWTIDMVGRTSGERTGYATQKPLELMRRIIEASTVPGDLCADFFCGSGSFLTAAAELGRRFTGCDSEELAVSITKKRLDSIQASYSYLVGEDDMIFHKGLEMEKIRSEEMENGKKLMEYRVKRFEPDYDPGHILMADRSDLSETISQDPLSFIDNIMIDPDHDGVFSAEMIVDKCFENIMLISRGDAAFIAVDIFGKEYYSDGK